MKLASVPARHMLLAEDHHIDSLLEGSLAGGRALLKSLSRQRERGQYCPYAHGPAAQAKITNTAHDPIPGVDHHTGMGQNERKGRE